ncbi:hypothetical protein F4810DRAFT_707085 [Camillea tinctor]|nr:hypothetical protein F4810DRAFT_707085 [Camillea tinctor]
MAMVSVFSLAILAIPAISNPWFHASSLSTLHNQPISRPRISQVDWPFTNELAMMECICKTGEQVSKGAGQQGSEHSVHPCSCRPSRWATRMAIEMPLSLRTGLLWARLIEKLDMLPPSPGESALRESPFAMQPQTRWLAPSLAGIMHVGV